MKILITGGTVFVSKRLAEFFLAEGNEVFVLNRGTHPQVEGAVLVKANRYEIGNTLKDLSFDAVIAVNTYEEKDMKALLDALCDNVGFKKKYRFKDFVFISSSAVYPELNVQPFSEEQSIGWNKIWGDYGLNKVNAEKLLQKRFKDAYILRPPYLYGEGNNVYREAFVFDCAEQGRSFYLPEDGAMKMQFFAVEDLCRFVKIILEEKPLQKIFNVGNEKSVSVKEWVSLCFKACGKEPQFVNVPASVPIRSYFPFHNYEYELDVSKQLEIFTPLVSLEEGLKASYEWYKSNREEVSRREYFKFIDENLESK